MRTKISKILKSYLIGWFIANCIWFMATHVTPNEISSVNETAIGEIYMFLVTWIAQAIVYGLLYVAIDRFIKGRVPFYKLQIYAVLLQIAMGAILVVLVFYLFKVFDVVDTSTSIIVFVSELPGLWLAFIYALVVNFTINLFMYIDLTLGKGNLLKIIKGSFYLPKEHQHIFMFLDLKGSTTHAERLGHIKYSQLIQDCFYDLAVVDAYKAEVYQYVGDEAVLTWSLEQGVHNDNCIRAFYAFKAQLQKRAAYYMANYNAIPVFKAGVNVGLVTVTEVGEIKREIAYHGDTINVAARLQDQCNRLGAELIISETMLNTLNLGNWINTKAMGEIVLRGKERNVNMYSLEKV
ncbi:adenylate/guanylate cyclase domain-containing protein [Flavobacteriaceae bacterium 3-367]